MFLSGLVLSSVGVELPMLAHHPVPLAVGVDHSKYTAVLLGERIPPAPFLFKHNIRPNSAVLPASAGLA